MITITITFSEIAATILIVFALLILAGLVWVIWLLNSIADDCIKLNYIDSTLTEFSKKFDDETKK